MGRDIYLKLLTQDKANCAQTCLAMVSGKQPAEIEELVGREEGLSLEGIKLGCMVLGVPIVGQWTSKPYKTRWGEREFPVNCILCVYSGKTAHAVICFDNMIYDPNGRKYHCSEIRNKSLKYLELKSETLNITATWNYTDGIRRLGVYRSYLKVG